MSSPVCFGAGYIGNFAVGATNVDFKFNTAAATGAPADLSGAPAAAVYIDGNATEITTGLTLTAPYDSKTGLNQILLTTASGYSAGNHSVVMTGGNVGVPGVAGVVVGEFSLGASRVDNVTFWNGTAVTSPATPGVPVVSLASTGLDAISATGPSGVAATFREKVLQVWERLFRPTKLNRSSGTLKMYASDGTTLRTTQTIADDGTTQSIGNST